MYKINNQLGINVAIQFHKLYNPTHLFELLYKFWKQNILELMILFCRKKKKKEKLKTASTSKFFTTFGCLISFNKVLKQLIIINTIIF
jgi:hypothetical protein